MLKGIFGSKPAALLDAPSEQGQQALSVINDPFNKKGIGDIDIHYITSWGDKPYWYAKVEFKNGNTKGEQRTPNVATYEEVLMHLKAILNEVNR